MGNEVKVRLKRRNDRVAESGYRTDDGVKAASKRTQGQEVAVV